MKKIMIFAAFAALISVASCQKEIVDNSSVESPIFTAIIDGGNTKTTVNLTNGKVSWESTDEITVKDNSSHTAIYKVKSIDAGTGKATFEFKSGQTLNTTGSYSATYGTAPTTSQTYSATAGKLYMTAPSTSTGTFTFSVQCGLVKINLQKTGQSVKSIEVYGKLKGTFDYKTYTLTCNPAVSISSEAVDFFVAIPDSELQISKISIKNDYDKTIALNVKNNNYISVKKNHIVPITFPESKLNFPPNIPEGALPGAFTIDPDGIPNSGDEKKIHFAKGNLVAEYGWNSDWTSREFSSWKFANRQIDIIGNGNGSIGSPSTGTEIDLFCWSTTKSNYGTTTETSTFPEDIYYGEFKDWGDAYCASNNLPQGTWRTPTSEEWESLVHYVPSLNGYNAAYAKVHDLHCLILLPDDWKWDDEDDYNKTVGTGWSYEYPEYAMEDYGWGAKYAWSSMEAKGAVCFPLGGFRYGTQIYTPGQQGGYWTSTPVPLDRVYESVDWGGTPVHGMLLHFNEGSLGETQGLTIYGNIGNFGYSVRLITEEK